VVGILFFTFRKGLESSLNESKHKYNVAHWLEELGRNQITFKMAGNSELPLENVDKAVSNYLTYRTKHFRILLIQGGLLVAFKVLISAGLLLLGSILIIQNQINIGQFVAAEIIIILVLASVEKLIFSMEPLYDILTALEKIGTVTDLPLDGTHDEFVQPSEMKEGKVSIKLSDLSYKFHGQHHNSLNNINLNINAGEKWCITGMNGAGKSLLIQIISGLYEDYEGSIQVNGYSMKDLDKNFFRQYTGIQFSREKLFEGSLMENISLGRSHIDINAIQKALKITTLADDMNSLSLSLKTHIMSEGKNLPKSTIQKILMARCIVGDPPLIIVEDNLHLWQPAAANDMMRYLLQSSATVILVTRRGSVAKQFPNIALLENGQITHAGTNNFPQS
jgi:ABC-type bacteriocin/lantibiotic exporter with double-glycine peptidase domain